VDLFGSQEQADRNWKVVRGTFFAQISGGEIDGNAFVPGISERGVSDRGADTFARFLDGSIRQANNREPRLTIGNVHLDIDECAVETDDRARDYFGEHAEILTREKN
jgi:hypothetical protein